MTARRVNALARALLPLSVVHQLRWARARLQAFRAGAGYRGQGRRHALPGRLVVSVTSFAPRFGTLHLALRSLLRQSVAADAVILWIAHDELPLLPAKVRQLEARGLSIRGCDDLRSYKKLVCALEQFPDAFIITADDDLFYRPTLIEDLVTGFDPATPTIACVRAHRVKFGEDGRIAPYQTWDWAVRDDRARRPATDIMPTGGAGCLYPPGSLHPDVTRRELFEQLAPTADDLWFYWMGRRAGSRYQVVGRSSKLITWPSPEQHTLIAINLAGGNDRQIRALEERFGNPLSF